MAQDEQYLLDDRENFFGKKSLISELYLGVVLNVPLDHLLLFFLQTRRMLSRYEVKVFHGTLAVAPLVTSNRKIDSQITLN